MGVTPLIISGNVATSIAVQNSFRAADAACVHYMRGYTNDAATADQMRTYATCVARLYPAPLGPIANAVLKTCIVGLILAMVIGGVMGYLNRRENMREYGMGPIAGPILYAIMFVCVAALGMVAVFLTFYGIKIVIS